MPVVNGESIMLRVNAAVCALLTIPTHCVPSRCVPSPTTALQAMKHIFVIHGGLYCCAQHLSSFSSNPEHDMLHFFKCYFFMISKPFVTCASYFLYCPH